MIADQPASLPEYATVHGYGRVQWADVVATLGPTPAAWADYDGFHLAPAPRQPPPYTHLWAWAPEWLLRARIDGPHAIVAVLQTGSHAPDGLTPRRSEPSVPFVRRISRTWPAKERRIGPLTSGVTDRAVELYEVRGQAPVTFIGMRPQ